MARILVVGSGASGVHAALTLLEGGHHVELLDVGYERPASPFPDATFGALKERLDDSTAYFLGEAGEGVVYPSPDGKPYGFPPSKGYVFRRPSQVVVREAGFTPTLSFARGGLAEAWTGGSYELRDEELADFPFAASELRPHYATVAQRIGITGAEDDLRRFSPLTSGYTPPLPADEHSAAILERYTARREALNATGFYLGRSRVAVLTRDLGPRGACTHLGRCLWGCPRGSLYTPGHTLTDLLAHPRFAYRPGVFVSRLMIGSGQRAVGVFATALENGGELEFRADRVLLAAGALATTTIYLQTMASLGVSAPALPGLMDNRHVMVPFVNLSRLGADVRTDSYQYHMLAMGIDTGDWRTDVHGQISTLKAAAVHPVVHGLPFDLRTSLRVFRRIRGALGVANIWLADRRRGANVARLERTSTGGNGLVLEYGDDSSDLGATHVAVDNTRQALKRLGCVAPRGQVRILERGSSVHYAGTIPMTPDETEHSCRPDGSARAFPGLFIADGASFPWLPAKNITFTLMANAVRIAAQFR